MRAVRLCGYPDAGTGGRGDAGAGGRLFWAPVVRQAGAVLAGQIGAGRPAGNRLRRFPGHQHPDPALQHAGALSQSVSRQRRGPDQPALAACAGRILYRRIENGGIAANTNAAAELATGEYLALADHDDILAPHAIFCMGRAASRTGADFLYSDEALFRKNPRAAHVAHFKPDYAPDYLNACNYICHLAVFRRRLFEQVGGERKICEGAQDHDLFLRIIDAMQLENPAAAPVHIPQVLYYWRVHSGSTSSGTGAKPYVEEAARRAVADHLAATGREGIVEPGLFPGTCHVKWALPEPAPLVSILIPNKDHVEDLETCLHSLKTSRSS